MPWPKRIVRHGVTFTFGPYPSQLKNPAKWRVAIYSEGCLCGVAPSLREAVSRVKAGHYDTMKEHYDDGRGPDDGDDP